jgi:hypothetical protein
MRSPVGADISDDDVLELVECRLLQVMGALGSTRRRLSWHGDFAGATGCSKIVGA